MILADKIIELRKRNGWSQEELAEKLDVSRQSVSKWEGAQAVPDMNRILQMSELFGVSTDMLLKDSMTLDAADGVLAEDVPANRLVTLEEASEFLEARGTAANRIALGVMMCILSPVLLIALAGIQSRFSLSEVQVAGIGVSALLLLVAGAVAIFVLSGMRMSRFEYLEKEPIETAYGVDGMVRERRERFRPVFTLQMTLGIALCVVSAIPIFLTMIFFDGDHLLTQLSVSALLVLVAIGVLLIVRSSTIWGGFQMLLQEGDYTRRNKEENRKDAPLAQIYWGAAVAIYLAWSFLSGAWDRTWIVWPIAGVAYGVIIGIVRMLRNRA